MTDTLAGPSTSTSDHPGSSPVATSPAAQLTVIIPAYNEVASVGDTVRSVLEQTTAPARIIVVDDGSTDGTALAAREAGAQVITPPANTGSKAGAQNFALEYVDTQYCMAIDADTTLAPDAIERLLAPLRRRLRASRRPAASSSRGT